MNITYQNHENHCGICVINSLIKHYFKTSNFNEILTNANISTKGLNIFEFESLCLKYGILAETYETNVIELEKLNINDYFVLVVYNNNNNHFVIAKKIKNGIKIYDSAKGKYVLDYQQLSKIFANIFIKISKIKSKQLIKLNSKKWTNYLNINLILLGTLINIIIASLSICFGLFMNYILDLCIVSENIKNLIIICFSFVVISCLKHLFNYSLIFFNAKYIKEQFYFYKSKLINNLFNKKSGLFNKVHKNNFFILNTAIITICNFNVCTIPIMISNLIIGLICICILISNSFYFLISLIILIGFQIFYLITNLNFQRQSLENNIKNANKISIYSNQYIQNEKCYNNYFISNELKENLNNEFNTSLRNNIFQSITSNKLSLIFNLFQDILFITTSFMSIIMIWNDNNLTIGKILFIINIQLLLTNNISEISNFFIQLFIYKKMNHVYLSFCDINTINNKSTIVINKIDSIKEVKNNKLNNLINGKIYHRNNFYELSNCLLNQSQTENYKIKINDYFTSKINQNWLKESVYYFNHEINFAIGNLDYDTISNNVTIDCIKKFNLKIDEPQDINEIIMLNVLKLFCCKNKIIILDKYLNNLPYKYKKYICNHIINELIKNNFILINE